MASIQPIKLGVLIWSQHTDWAPLRDAAVRADRLGYDAVWAWDHLYPNVGFAEGRNLEGYLTLAAWAALTERARLGLMVGANTFRNPALTAKMATTLDHISGGRAVLGIGGGWFEEEHDAFGLEFGSGFAERLDWLDEAVEIMAGMLRGAEPTARGPHYHARAVRNDPPPLQSRLPILIGGGGERKTLRTVARFADIWDIGGSPDEVRHKDEVLRRWCAEIGRDERQIERSLSGGPIVIRDSDADAHRVASGLRERNPGWDRSEVVGSPARIVEYLAPYVELGFHMIHIDLPAPFDAETLERFIGEVGPQLAAAGSSAAAAT